MQIFMTEEFPVNDQNTTIGKLSQQTLILNKGFLPIQISSVRHAIELMFQERAKAVDENYITYTSDEWIVNSTIRFKGGLVSKDQIIHGVSILVEIPRVIFLTDYNVIPRQIVRFKRRDVFLRDNYVCQYCGLAGTGNSLTIDHILPKARGGQTNWENCVTSCQPCNTKKADKTIEEIGFILKAGLPKKPNLSVHFTKTIKKDPTWNKFI